MIKFYVAAIRLNEKFLIAGPFLTEEEATQQMVKMRGLDLDLCPVDCISPTKTRSKAVVWYVKQVADDPTSWLGNGYAPDDQAALS